MHMLTEKPDLGDGLQGYDPRRIGNTRKVAEEIRQNLGAYYRSQKALTPEIETKINSFCDWLGKKKKTWLMEQISKDLKEHKLIVNQKVGMDEILGAYLGMRYLFETEAIAGKQAKLPILVLGNNLAGAGGYLPDMHTILLPDTEYLAGETKYGFKKRAFENGTEKMIVMFNETLHESAHSFRRANELKQDVDEIGTYFIQTKYGFPIKRTGSEWDYIMGQRSIQNIIGQNRKENIVNDSADIYFGKEYLEYFIGPFVEKYYDEKGLTLPKFYEFVKKEQVVPEKPEKIGIDGIRDALEKYATVKLGEMVENIVQTLYVPDKGFNDEVKNAYYLAIQKRLGLSDEEMVSLRDKSAHEIYRKCNEPAIGEGQTGLNFRRLLYDILEKKIGQPKNKGIPDGFVHKTEKNATEFFS